jgi:hypothetical protein
MRGTERNLEDEVGVEPDTVDGREKAGQWPRPESDDRRDATEPVVLVGHM